MSYTTRCPACGTTFRVVPDQLKLSDGWVRCGHCADVFDARLYLERWTPPPQPAVDPTTEAGAEPPAPVQQGPEALAQSQPSDVGLSQRVASPTAVDAAFAAPEPGSVRAFEWRAGATDMRLQSPVASDRSASNGVAFDGGAPVPSAMSDLGGPAPQALPSDASGSAWTDWDATSGPGTLETESPSAPTAVAGAPAAPAAAVDDFHAELARFAAASVRPAPAEPPQTPAAIPPAAPGFSDPDQVARLQASIDAQDASPGTPDARDQPDEDEAAEEPGFMREARRQAFWRTPGVRVALSLVALLLSALLAAQWAVHERDRLAASRPDLAPWLKQLCVPLGCSIAPLRHIDAVVIDSSTLARRLGNFYAFDVVLKNTASVPVALPALELSLTDTRDQVIARRVFLQQDLPGAPALLPAQGSAPLSLRLSITDVGPVPMAGYRALVFYP